MGAGPSHEVDDGGHLLDQGQRMIFAHPQCTFKSEWDKIEEGSNMHTT